MIWIAPDDLRRSLFRIRTAQIDSEGMQPMMSEQDQRIHAFEGLYQQYYFPSVKYAMKKIQNAQDAEDIVCNAFLYCYEHYAEYDPQKACFSTWLYLVLNSRIKNYYRDRKDAIVLEHVREAALDTMCSVEDALELTQKRAQIAKALERLPETQRRVVIMKYFKKYSSKQISEKTGLSEANVRVILSRGIKQMRKLVSIDG